MLMKNKSEKIVSDFQGQNEGYKIIVYESPVPDVNCQIEVRMYYDNFNAVQNLGANDLLAIADYPYLLEGLLAKLKRMIDEMREGEKDGE